MNKYQRKLERYLPFYQYYRSGATFRDYYYFRRVKKDLSSENGTLVLEVDSEMSTDYDLLAARLIAVEMLLGYLSRKISLMEKHKCHAGKEISLDRQESCGCGAHIWYLGDGKCGQRKSRYH